MRNAFVRFALCFGLLGVFMISSGFHCHVDDDPYYDPPYFNLTIENYDSVAVDIYIDGVYEDTVDPYSDLIILEVPESSNTELYGEGVGGSGEWGPEIIDTRFAVTRTWILDPYEYFTLTVDNYDIYVGCDVYVDDQYIGTVPADSYESFDFIPTSSTSKIEVDALDGSWFYEEYFDTTGTGSGYSGEYTVTVP